jgi:hypothetical protein
MSGLLILFLLSQSEMQYVIISTSKQYKHIINYFYTFLLYCFKMQSVSISTRKHYTHITTYFQFFFVTKSLKYSNVDISICDQNN